MEGVTENLILTESHEFFRLTGAQMMARTCHLGKLG
jgi:hypothetical protein